MHESHLKACVVALKSLGGQYNGLVQASAEPHALLLAHVRAHKEGLQFAFALDVDEASALAGVAQLLKHV